MFSWTHAKCSAKSSLHELHAKHSLRETPWNTNAAVICLYRYSSGRLQPVLVRKSLPQPLLNVPTVVGGKVDELKSSAISPKITSVVSFPQISLVPVCDPQLACLYIGRSQATSGGMTDFFLPGSSKYLCHIELGCIILWLHFCIKRGCNSSYIIGELWNYSWTID